MPAPQRTARIEDDIWDPAQERAKTEGASLSTLMRAAVHRYATGDLTSNAEPASQPQPLAASQGTPALVTAMSPGEPSSGVLCMTPGCFQRDTRKYGLRNLQTVYREAPPEHPTAVQHTEVSRPVGLDQVLLG